MLYSRAQIDSLTHGLVGRKTGAVEKNILETTQQLISWLEDIKEVIGLPLDADCWLVGRTVQDMCQENGWNLVVEANKGWEKDGD